MDFNHKYNAKDWFDIYQFMLNFIKYKSIKLVKLTEDEIAVVNRFKLKELYNNNGLNELGINLFISLHFIFTAFNDNLQFGNKDYHYIVATGQENIMFCVWNNIEADIKNGIVPEPYNYYESKEINIINRIR